MFIYMFLVMFPQVCNKFKEYKKNNNFKIIKVMKSMSKNKFSHYLLGSDFNDMF